MAGIITPLSRRPKWAFFVFFPLLGIILVHEVVRVFRATVPIQTSDWKELSFLVALIIFSYYGFNSLPVADYDADYLYFFKKSGTEQIPLGNFYQLKAGNRGYWHLYYYDEQAAKRKLGILPVGSGDNSSIHGFIAAVWQHNPQLDIQHDWFR